MDYISLNYGLYINKLYRHIFFIEITMLELCKVHKLYAWRTLLRFQIITKFLITNWKTRFQSGRPKYWWL